MHVIAERRIRLDGVDNALAEIARMRRGEAHAADAGNLPDVIEQRGEIPARGRRIAIAVHVLAEQLNFAVARARQLQRFGDHRRAGAAALRTARERDHAIGAGFVAAFDDREVGAMRIVAAGHRRLEGVLGIEAQAGDAAVAGFELHQHLREAGCSWPSRTPG